jgi:hypothetical protein
MPGGGRILPSSRDPKPGRGGQDIDATQNWTLTLSTALVILTCMARAKAETTCSTDMLKGGFEFTATGFLVAPSPIAGPFAAVGTQSFDGNGNTEAASTVSVNGAAERVTLRGVYSINPDCTGSMTLTLSPSGLVQHFDLIVSPKGTEIRSIRTDAGVVGTGVYQKMSGDELR